MADFIDRLKERFMSIEMKALGAFLGLYVVCRATLSGLSILWYNLKQEKDLVSRYGAKSWAIITGATGRFGKVFVEEFAKRGFNIVLLSESQEKLERAKLKLEKEYPELQFLFITADFRKIFETDFLANIYEKIKDLDISILVNSAELNAQTFWKLDFKTIRDMIAVNEASYVLMTKLLISQLKSRSGKRSLIINVGSILARAPITASALYCSSKGFVEYFSESLAKEYQNKVDIISYLPRRIGTSLQDSETEGINETHPRESVCGLLTQVGYRTQTAGVWSEQLDLLCLSTPLGGRLALFIEEKIEKGSPKTS